MNGIGRQLRGKRHWVDGSSSIGTIFPDIHEVGCRVRRQHGFVETGFGNLNLMDFGLTRVTCKEGQPDKLLTVTGSKTGVLGPGKYTLMWQVSKVADA